ncbi:unnamed protein product, partial [Protopolystoma xenopodis]
MVEQCVLDPIWQQFDISSGSGSSNDDDGDTKAIDTTICSADESDRATGGSGPSDLLIVRHFIFLRQSLLSIGE